MKHNTPTHMNRHLTAPLRQRREGEFAVNARLLYPFIAHPMVSFEKWIESLLDLNNDRYHRSKFRLISGDNGELYLNEELASYSAGLVAYDVVGAIALALIHEGVEAASAGDPDFTNRKLNAYKDFTISNDLIPAALLHRFLGVSNGFSDWLHDLKQRHGMRYGSDYKRVFVNARGKVEGHRLDTGMGCVVFCHRFAFEVAASEPTHIGSLMQLCMKNFCRDQ
jgi:hypothetical protein